MGTEVKQVRSWTKNLTTFNETRGNDVRTNDTMEDSELEQIRANRMAQMGAQGGAGGSREDAAKAQEEQKKQIEDMKNSILSQCLNQEARARLNTIKTTKPEHAAMIENNLCMMARSGQIGGKLSDEDFKGLLARVSAGTSQQKPKSTVTFNRRRVALDSDEESD